MMYRLLALVVTALALAYAAGALYFYRQERWAWEPSAARSVDVADLRHPEAVLGTLQERFARQRFGSSERFLVRQALVRAPSFYQAPFFLATYYSSRLEKPAVVRASYEAAIERYPANGRLRLAYAQWLLESRTRLDGWRDPDDPTRLSDPLTVAEVHLRRGMELERDLSWRALDTLERYRVPPERWRALTPDDELSRRHLMDALFRGKHFEAGLALLRESVDASHDVDVLQRAASFALDGGAPELALDAALKWQSVLERGGGGVSPRYIDAAVAISRAHLALGDIERSNRALEESLSKVETEFGPSSRLTLEALCAFGHEHLDRGQAFSAASFYGQAVSRSPSHVPALLGLARSLRRSGDDRGAIHRYEDVLRLEPEHEVARNELRNLLARTSLR